MRTITALFDNRNDAEEARARLEAAGIGKSHVTIHDKSVFDAEPVGSTPDALSANYNGNLSERSVRGSLDDQPPKTRSDGSAGTHRNVMGDFVDDRTDKSVGSDSGSDRNALGDFVNDHGQRRGEEYAGGEQHDETDRDVGLWEKIKAFFSADDDVYAEGLRRGGFLLTARVEDHDVDRFIDILDDDGVVSLDDRQASWKQEGWVPTTTQDHAAEPLRPRVRSYEYPKPMM